MKPLPEIMVIKYNKEMAIVIAHVNYEIEYHGNQKHRLKAWPL